MAAKGRVLAVGISDAAKFLPLTEQERKAQQKDWEETICIRQIVKEFFSQSWSDRKPSLRDQVSSY